MQEQRARRRTVLVLALILGVLGMHSLVALPAEVMASPVAHVLTTPDGHPSAAVQPPEDPAPVPPMPMPPMPGHDMQHLCLAVLAVVLVLAPAAALLAVVIARGADPAARAVRAVRAAPRRPPRDHAVRLAELCVLRN